MTEESLFLAALEKHTPAERQAFLEEACGADATLRARVQMLLEADARARGILDRTAAGVPELTRGYVRGEQPGAVIAGRYKLLEAIGEGGMGAVWVAEQTQPVRRKVALKLIKAGMDSNSVLARFEAERQALAVMDHPNIAKVLDGGLTETGRPYFVMEYVKGVPITEYCDATRLSVPQRLDLFVQVCQAVQHAHQKGIIHRDLKPSNILVAPYDDKPVPKVIDFGLVKAIHQSLTERTLHTAHESVLGTPLYMSPEQAQLNNLDVDTRSDIYSLGVLLYELLTGTTPLERNRFKEAAWDEMRRLIREEEPPRPSTRLSSSQALPSLAAGRHSEPTRLTKLVRGELDWIVMKSLEKDRTRRYETANGFAMDIQRYLAGEPVLAAPPSARYRLRKFARKYRAALTTGAALVLLLVAGVAVSTWQAVRATRAETAAVQAQQAEAERAEGERQARLDAQARQAEAEKQQTRALAGEKLAGERLTQVEAEKKIAQSVRDFLQKKLLAQTDTTRQADALLKAGASSSGAKLNPTIRELLDRAAQELAPDKIEESFPKQPLIQAEILQTIGDTYRGIGEYQPAIDFLKRSEALRRQHLGPEHPDTLSSMNSLAVAYWATGKLDLALPLFKEPLKLMKAKLGPEHADTLRGMNGLAAVYYAAGKLDLALPLLEETLELQKAKLGPEHPDTLISMGNLATVYYAAGKLDLALPLYEETLRLMKAKLGPEHPNTLTNMDNLAVVYRAAGKLDLALPLLEETLKVMKAKLGPEHPDTLRSMKHLVVAYQAAGKLDLALPFLEETLELQKAKLGPEHPDTLVGMGNLARAYYAAGKLDLVLPLLEESLRLQKAKLGSEHPETLKVMGNLEFVRNMTTAEERYRVELAKNGPGHIHTLLARRDLAQYYMAVHRLDDAEQTLFEVIRGMKDRASDDAILVFTIGLLRKSLATRERTMPDAWLTFQSKSLLGEALLGQKKYAEAEPLLLAGYEGMKKREAKIPPQSKVRVTEALERVVRLYEALDKKDDAARWRKVYDILVLSAQPT